MKRYIIAAITILAASNALADDKSEACKNAGQAAKSIMQARQNNTDMSTLMAIVEKQEEGDAFKTIARTMVISAYDQPAWQTDERKEQAIAQFSNDVQLACYKGLK